MKCGTSATSTFLRQHSKLFDMGSGFHIDIFNNFRKFSINMLKTGWLGETYYFNRYYDRGEKFYQSFMRSQPGQILFEKTPTYYKNLKVGKSL